MAVALQMVTQKALWRYVRALLIFIRRWYKDWALPIMLKVP